MWQCHTCVYQVFFRYTVWLNWNDFKGWLTAGLLFKGSVCVKRKRKEEFYFPTRKGLEIPASFRASSNQLSAAWLAFFSQDVGGGAGPLTGTRTAGSVFISALHLSIKKKKLVTLQTHVYMSILFCINVCVCVTRGFRRHLVWTSLSNHRVLFLE